MPVENNSTPTEQVTEEKKTTIKKLKEYFILLMVALMGLGNWADTKALSIEAYNGFITNFTNKIEEKKISKLDIGNYLPYAQKQIGIPQVIKTSKIDERYEYRYYKEDKYLLTLINKETRIVAIVVHSLSYDKSLVDDFSPKVPFSNFKLKEHSLEQIVPDSNEFFYDSNNIKYYMQVKQLNAQGVFLNLTSGFSDYTELKGNVAEDLFKLDEVTLMSDEQTLTSPITKKLATNKATFYAISELPSEYIADSLLTKYEFNVYF